MSRCCYMFLLSMMAALTSIAQQTDTIKVKVHDQVMTLYVGGEGKPAVILESGGGPWWITDRSAEPKMSRSPMK